jgi:imidazolonepropionase-like amidohydrolase
MKNEVRERSSRPLVRLAVVLASAAASGSLAHVAFAQVGLVAKPEVVVLQGGTVHVGNGDVIDGGSVILKGKRIDAVGKGLPVPEGAKVVDVTGRHVYPGLIDAESGLMLDPDASNAGEGQPTSSAVDALDPFRLHDRDEAWAGGVTSVYVAAHRGLLDGAGAVLKLRDAHAAGDFVVRKDFAITATFGVNGDRPSMRLREWKGFRDRLEQTKKYADAWDDYEEKLTEYKAELEKLKKEGKTKLDKKEEGPKPPTPPGTPPGRPDEGPGGPERPGGPGRRPRRRPPSGSLLPWILGGGTDAASGRALHIDEHGDGPDGDPHDCTKSPDGLTWKDGVSDAEDAPQAGGGEKKEEAKKPPRPARDAQLEMLRRLLEGKVELRVQAARAADLQNLLDTRAAYSLDVVVTGGADALKLAPELARANVPVVFALAADAAPEVAAIPARLAAASVDFALTADDPGAASTRFLGLVAAAAVAGGLDREAALTAVTAAPARILGVADRVGTLEAGKDADVVVTRGEIFSSSMVVERLYVDGRAVLPR